MPAHTKSPFLIAGLGNPGRSYTHTRHNLGFLVIDAVLNLLTPAQKPTHPQLSSDHPIIAPHLQPFRPRTETSRNHQSELWHYSLTHSTHPTRVILAKPQTFMNRSGSALASLIRFYNIARSQIIVIYDDVSLPFGHLKLRHTGTSGGHNGLASIIGHIGKDFIRLKGGIGISPALEPATTVLAPLKIPLETYVLNPFATNEKNLLPAYCEVLAFIVLSVVLSLTTAVLPQSPSKLTSKSTPQSPSRPPSKSSQTTLASNLETAISRTASLVNGKYFKDIVLSPF